MKIVNYKIKFIIPGHPFTKKYKISGNKMYKNNKTRSFEEGIQLIAKNYMMKHNLKPLEGCIFLKLIIYVYQRKITVTGINNMIFCTKSPDCTNVLKSVEDGLKNICFLDDRKVVSVKLEKYCCFSFLEERIEIFINNFQYKEKNYGNK